MKEPACPVVPFPDCGMMASAAGARLLGCPVRGLSRAAAEPLLLAARLAPESTYLTVEYQTGFRSWCASRVLAGILAVAC